MEDKKSDFFSASKMPTVVIEKISHYLHPSPLVKMQLVNHSTREAAQQAITLDIQAIPTLPERERNSVWCIYESLRKFNIFEEFRNLEDRNLRIDSTAIPPLPAAPIDKYASLRSKRQLRQLTVEEIELLQAEGFRLDPKNDRIPSLPTPLGDPWASIRPKRVVGQLTAAERQFLYEEGIFSAQIPHLPPITDRYASIRLKTDVGELIEEEIEILKQDNFLPRDFLPPYQSDFPLPPLPKDLVDSWAALRHKRCMWDLTLLEIHQLFTNGLLDEYLLQLGKNDYEKASLIMESPFLRTHLPPRERTRPWLFSRIFCAFLFAILSSLFTLIFFTFSLLVSVMFSLIYVLLSPISILVTGKFFAFLSMAFELIKRIIPCAILAVIYPIYCFFAGAYIGYKFGFSGINLVTKLIRDRPFDAIFLFSFKALFTLPKIFPDMLIADMALYAERIKQQDNICKFCFSMGAIPVPEGRRELVETKSAAPIELRPLLAVGGTEDDASLSGHTRSPLS